MVKNNKKSTKRKPKNMNQIIKYKPAATNDSSLRLRNHIGMILDPCNAILGPTAYRGADGFITRFKNVVAAGTTPANPYYVSVFYPAFNGVFLSAYATAGDIVTPTYSGGPGQAFLLSNAESQRVVGACVKVNYLGSELNRQGVVYRGVIPAAAVSGATIQNLIVLCQATDRMPDKILETKFVPSSVEETYWQTGPSAPSETGDRNVIVTIVAGGGAVQVDTYLEHTLITEWRPKFGVGLISPPPNTPDVPSGLERVRTTLSQLGNWWVEAAHTASSAVHTASSIYRGTKMLGNVARLAITAA